MAAAAVLERIGSLPEPLAVAVDGRCGAGKTTLAELLRERTDCNVIHADSFFLRPEQRTAERRFAERRFAERLSVPFVNIDHERLAAEVLEPLRRGEEFSYRAFDCKTGSFSEPITVRPAALTVLEGSYSCCPELWEYCGLHIFLTVDPDEQLRRIARRNGTAALSAFRDKWIPLEERYFSELKIAERCNMVLEMR